MISIDVFADTFGAVAPGDTDKLRKIAILAVRNGFAVVLDKPGSKVPLCPLVARAAKQADREAQEEARSAGDPHWDRRKHACGLHHAFTDAAQISRTLQRMIKNGITPNLGVEVGRSRMVVVDVDTVAERDAFLAAWTQAEGRDMTGMSPTVKSPGAQVDGAWKHKDGGHFWFMIPEGTELPEGGGVLRGEGGWSVLWRGKQVLVPPSARPEGEYRLVGQALQLPDWLREMILAGARQQEERRMTSALAARTSDSISAWAVDKPWSEILTMDGWTDTGKADNCGCPVWTAPGDHASPKSATAHEPGCAVYITDGGQAPIHIWTDNYPDCVAEVIAARGRTFSKFHYLVYRIYGGDQARAKAELGINDGINGFDREDAVAVAAAETDDEGPEDWSDFGLPSGDAAPAGGGGGAQPPITSILPDEFWDARPELRHIRQAARSKRIPPDAVLQGIFVRLAASVPGTLKVDTGILTPVSLNYFAAIVGESGIGKSTSVDLAEALLPQVPGLEDLWRRPLGSGEGMSEAYMGNREEGTGEFYQSGPRQGEEKTRTVRAQVIDNALFFLDEGESLAKLMAERSGATLGQQIRTAWTGGTLGQSNGTAERTRIVREYAMGLLIGYQPETAYSLLDGVVQGTPQRFVWGRVADPRLPDLRPGWPGMLDLDLRTMIADPAAEEDPKSITMVESLRREIDAIHLDRLKGKVGDDLKGFNSHRQATLIKISGLLAVLAGRNVITEEDWDLAKIIWKVSCRVRDILIDLRKTVEAKKAEERTKRDVERAVAVAKSTGNLDAKIERMAKRLVEIIADEGPQKRGYLNSKIGPRNRPYLSDAIEHAIDEQWLNRGEEEALEIGPKRP